MSNQNKSIGIYLFDIATALTLVSALIYATGWTYAYHYFGYFKLGLLLLEIPNHYYFMYGFWVIKAWWWLIALIYILLAFAVPLLKPSLENLAAKQTLLLKHAQIWVVLMAFVLMWWLALVQAESYYLEQHNKGFTAYPLVRVWPKAPQPENKKLVKVYQALPEAKYRLLLQNKDRLFLFSLPADGKPARPAILQLDLSEIRTMKLLP